MSSTSTLKKRRQRPTSERAAPPTITTVSYPFPIAWSCCSISIGSLALTSRDSRAPPTRRPLKPTGCFGEECRGHDTETCCTMSYQHCEPTPGRQVDRQG